MRLNTFQNSARNNNWATSCPRLVPEFEQQSGIGFVIQSPSAPASTLHEKTLEFLSNEVTRLAEMSPDNYAQNQEGLVAQVLEKGQKISAVGLGGTGQTWMRDTVTLMGTNN